MHIQSVVFTDGIHCFAKSDTFAFKAKTLLVGDQGCGKSTLLECLAHQRNLQVNLSRQSQLFGVNFFYYDTERENPRIKDPLSYTKPSGESKGIGIGAALSSRFHSHGEVLVDFTVNGLKKLENCIVLFDEPESGLSIRNQYRLAREIDEAIKRNCQIIMATHCLPVIEAAEEVLSLEHRRWMPSKEFIDLNKEKRN